MKSSGKTYQDHYATLLHLYEKDKEELQKKNDRSRVPTIEKYMRGDPFKIAIEDGASFQNTNLSQEEKNDIMRWTKN